MSRLPKIDFPNVLRGAFDPAAGAIKFIDTSQLIPTAYDSIDLSYSGTSVTGVVYKLDGSTVATLALTYTGANLTNVTRS